MTGTTMTEERRAELRKQLAEMNAPHLRKKLYAFVWTKNDGVSDDDMLELLPVHLQFIHHLEETGVLFASGPLFDGEDVPYSGGGLTIIRHSSFDDARKMMESEPFVKAGVRSFKLHRWMLNEGNFSLSVNFGTGKYEVR